MVLQHQRKHLVSQKTPRNRVWSRSSSEQLQNFPRVILRVWPIFMLTSINKYTEKICHDVETNSFFPSGSFVKPDQISCIVLSCQSTHRAGKILCHALDKWDVHVKVKTTLESDLSLKTRLYKYFQFKRSSPGIFTYSLCKTMIKDETLSQFCEYNV